MKGFGELKGFGAEWPDSPPECGEPHVPDQEAEVEHWRDDLGVVVAGLAESRERTHNIRRDGRLRDLPSHDALVSVLTRLSSALFPSHYGQTAVTAETVDAFVEVALAEALELLEEQVRRDIACAQANEEWTPDEIARRADSIVSRFARHLPELRGLLVGDLRAAFAGDPAAGSLPEIMLAYPGLLATRYYRIAHKLNELGAPLVARLVSQIAHSRTAIDIHPGARIGPSFFIDHGTGVVIGETAIIGNRVRIYQAVTLGSRSFTTEPDGSLVKGIARHPIIEDDVTIYAGATILGRITVGAGSVIGGNVWLTQSVPRDSAISQASLRREAGSESSTSLSP